MQSPYRQNRLIALLQNSNGVRNDMQRPVKSETMPIDFSEKPLSIKITHKDSQFLEKKRIQDPKTIPIIELH